MYILCVLFQFSIGTMLHVAVFHFGELIYLTSGAGSIWVPPTDFPLLDETVALAGGGGAAVSAGGGGGPSNDDCASAIQMKCIFHH